MTPLELREDQPARYTIVLDDEPIGAVSLVDDTAGPTARCRVIAPLTFAQARELVGLLDERGARRIDTIATLVRAAARDVGYRGPLRTPLTQSGTDATAFDIPTQIEQLLPGTRVRRRAPRNRWLRMAADATSGVAGMTQLHVDPIDERAGIRVDLPGRDDQLAETVALAVDTTFAVHARFGEEADFVRTISFDHAAHGMAEGKIGGAAPRLRGVIHLNANFSFASGLEAMQRPNTQRDIDGTTAHELWHKIEMGWESRRYSETIQFRRDIGEWFGHATLEQVFSDPSAQAALAAAVSPYAATARLEATAEMFKQWWCGPPPPGSIPERFGTLIAKYFPRS